LGGLLVAAVVKYADNVLKTYATAIAIILTCILTCVSTGMLPSIGFVQGMLMVIASIFLYNLGPASSSTSKPTTSPQPPPEPSGADEADDAASPQ